MDAKTQGVVLRCGKYSENQCIVQILTKDFGKVSYMVYAPQSKRARVRSTMLQPLTLLEIDTDSKPSREIQHIKDAKPLMPANFSPAKIAVAMFVADVVNACTVEGSPDLLIFNKVFDTIKILNTDAAIDAHFAIRFLLEFAEALGFNPVQDFENVLIQEFLGTLVEQSEKDLFLRLINAASQGNIAVFSHPERRTLVRTLLLYYKLNLPDMPHIKTLDVLEEIYTP